MSLSFGKSHQQAKSQLPLLGILVLQCDDWGVALTIWLHLLPLNLLSRFNTDHLHEYEHLLRTASSIQQCLPSYPGARPQSLELAMQQPTPCRRGAWCEHPTCSNQKLISKSSTSCLPPLHSSPLLILSPGCIPNESDGMCIKSVLPRHLHGPDREQVSTQVFLLAAST